MPASIDFSNMLHKPLRHGYVPADQASITFVFVDGMRRSFGAGPGSVIRFSDTALLEGMTLSEVSLGSENDLTFIGLKSDKGDWSIFFRGGDAFRELPE